MRIHRTAHTRAFSTYSNELLRDTRISWCASGLLTYLLSLPSQASTDIRKLAKLRREGRDRVAAALRELEEARYLRRRRFNDPLTGACCTEYEVYDVPYGTDPGPAHPLEPPQPGNPASGEPASGHPGALPSGERTRGKEPPSRPPRTGRRRARAPISVPDALRSAVTLLTSLAHREPRLALGAAEAVRLAPLVEEWRSAGVPDDTLRAALTDGLPEAVHSPCGLLGDRLRRKKPAPETAQSGPQVPAPRGSLAECATCRDPLAAAGRCRTCAGATPDTAHRTPEENGARTAARHGAAAVRAALRSRTSSARPREAPGQGRC